MWVLMAIKRKGIVKRRLQAGYLWNWAGLSERRADGNSARGYSP